MVPISIQFGNGQIVIESAIHSFSLWGRFHTIIAGMMSELCESEKRLRIFTEKSSDLFNV